MKGTALLALMLALGSGASLAEQPVDNVGGATNSKMHVPSVKMPHHFHGTVESVDASSGRITVKDKHGKTRDFTAGSNAKILSGKDTVSLDSVSVGDKVSVSYKGSEAQPQVEKIHIRKTSK